MPRNNEDLDPEEARKKYDEERARTLARERERELKLAEEVQQERDNG